MITSYEIYKFITEANNEVGKEILFTALDSKSFNLLISPMKTGKTTFIMQDLANILKSSNIQQIFVTPVLSLMNDLKSKYSKSIKCNGATKEIKLKDNNTIISTPESLHKAIKACEEEEKRYYIIYDEIHQVVLNARFRPNLKNPLLYYEKRLCMGFLGMTATPKPLENINFDNIFEIIPKEKFIQAEQTIIVKDFVKNADNMYSFIKYMKKANNNKLVIARINNKDDIKVMQNKLNNCVCWYREKDGKIQNSKYISDMDTMEDTLKGQDLKNIDYVLCTSLIDVGVEIQLEDKPIVIDFIDSNSTLVDDIQFTGRFRQGIKKLYLVGKLNSLEPYKKPNNFIKEYEEALKATKEWVISLNKRKDKYPQNVYYNDVGTQFNEDLDMYEVNEYSLMEYIFQQYIRFHLQTDVYLKLFLEWEKTFNTNRIETILFNDLDLDKKNKALEEEKKEIKDTIKKSEQEFLEEIKARNINDETLKLILNYDLVESKDLWKINKFDDVVSFWKDEHLEEYRKRYKQVSELFKKTKKNQLYILELTLSKDNFKKMYKEIQFIYYNQSYNDNESLIISKAKKEMLVVYSIRDYIIKIKSKERGIQLSNKFKFELLEHLRQKKSLSKMSAKQLDKHLNMIYNITCNN